MASENSTWADRIEKEADSLLKLKRKKPKLFWTAVFVATCYGLCSLFEMYHLSTKNAELTKQLRESDSELESRKTQAAILRASVENRLLSPESYPALSNFFVVSKLAPPLPASPKFSILIPVEGKELVEYPMLPVIGNESGTNSNNTSNLISVIPLSAHLIDTNNIPLVIALRNTTPEVAEVIEATLYVPEESLGPYDTNRWHETIGAGFFNGKSTRGLVCEFPAILGGNSRGMPSISLRPRLQTVTGTNVVPIGLLVRCKWGAAQAIELDFNTVRDKQSSVTNSPAISSRESPK